MRLQGVPTDHSQDALARKRVEQRAMDAVMAYERRLGFLPEDVTDQKQGWDVVSRVADTGKLRFIEVKGRVTGADTVTVTRNEILAGLNKPDDFILAIVLVNGTASEPVYIPQPFTREPDFGASGVIYELSDLLTSPRLKM